MPVYEKSLILGRAGCGKTTLLLETLCSTIKAQPSDNVLFLLPTQSQVEHIKDVIIRKGLAPGFIEKSICTFSKLARETLGYQGLKEPVTELEKGFVLREVLRGLPLQYFKGREGFQGFRTALLRFFKELKEDGQYPEQFRRAMDKFLKERVAASPEKYLALEEAYSLFESALEKRGLIDEDDLLNQLFQQLNADKPLLSNKKLLLVDGFHDFTPLEFRILRLLVKRIPGVLVSLVLDEVAYCNTPLQPFERSREVYKDLKALGLKPSLSKGFQRSTSTTLKQIEKSISGGLNPASEKIEADNALEVIEAVDIRDEVEQIARRIYQIVSGGETQYQDIVIIFRDIDPYRDIIEDVFHEYNIPVRIHIRKPLIENPLVKGILSLLQVFITSWKDEEALHALKSPYVILPHLEVDSLEYRIQEIGRQDSREAWTELMEKQSFVQCHETNKFIKDMAEAEKELDGLHPPSFFRSWLLRFINRFISFSEMLNNSQGLPLVYLSEHNSLLKEESQGLRAFLDLLGRQCQILNSPLTYMVFFEELQESLSCATYTLKDKRHEVVNVIDALEARQWEKPVVFVGGLLEKQFPRQGREDIFLKDAERGAFKRLTGINLQEILRRTHEEERFLFYVALTRARHKLVLSYPSTDGQGRPTTPSFYLEEVKEAFTPESYEKVFHKRTPLNFIPKPNEILVQKDLRNFVFYHLTSSHRMEAVGTYRAVVPLHELARVVYNRELAKKTPWLEGLRVVLEKPEEGKLEPIDTLKEILSSFSATQLSDYAQCPFLHFCRWVLKLKPIPNRAEDGLSPTLQGEIVHDTLKRYYDIILKGADGANLDTLFEESFKRKTRGIPLGFKEEKLRKEMLHALKTFAEQDREYIKKFQFRPQYLEASFGRERYEDRSIVYEDVRTAPSLPPLRLRDKNGNIVMLTGRIDRIDVAEIDGESLGLVIDYKYSREIKNESKTREEIIEEGTDLQLPIYILVAKNLLGLKPIGAQFFTLKSPGRSGIVSVPLPNKCEHIPQEELEALLESCKVHIFRQVEGILAGDKKVKPREARRCKAWCEYRDVCRYEGKHYKRSGEL